MKLNLAIADPNVASFFVIIRSVGEFAIGGWHDTKTKIRARGNVSVAAVTDIDEQPEGDRIRGAINVWCNQEIFVTHAAPTPGTSDIIFWHGEEYRVDSVVPYPERAYWKATCLRMSGS